LAVCICVLVWICFLERSGPEGVVLCWRSVRKAREWCLVCLDWLVPCSRSDNHSFLPFQSCSKSNEPWTELVSCVAYLRCRNCPVHSSLVRLVLLTRCESINVVSFVVPSWLALMQSLNWPTLSKALDFSDMEP
jgi:hypothetical protein